MHGRNGATEPSDPRLSPLLTRREVALMFRVNSKTITRWVRTGKLTAIHTPGGQRRFRADEIRTLLQRGPG